MKGSETGAIAVLAEKPSVARDIAGVLGAGKRAKGYLEGGGYVVTWAIGHLVALAQPHEIHPQWRQWRLDHLPMLPDRWPLVVYERSQDQFATVRQILNSPRISRIVCATDAGREGELIFRYIYEAAECKKPFSRLWISSLTPEAIRTGFERLRAGSDYDRLADAACGRSRADWLVGMNLSRAYSIAYGEELSVGRVQTPTLAMLVDRELALRRFVPEDYLEVIATFQRKEDAGGEGEGKSQFQATWFRPASASGRDKEAQPSRLPADGEEAERIVRRARTGEARIQALSSETHRMQPPLLYDLTELQRHANRLFGFSAQKTLDVAQALYEQHKLISYPRTDSRHLSSDIAATVPAIAGAISGSYREHLGRGSGERPLGRRYVDDSKVSDHHAIIPTTVSPSNRLSSDERAIYDLICRRFLMMWHEDHLQAVTTVIVSITNSPLPSAIASPPAPASPIPASPMEDTYRATGTVVEQVGWKLLDLTAGEKRPKAAAPSSGAQGDFGERSAEQVLPVTLALGQLQDVTAAEARKKKTRPPKRFTEATLLTGMETAGKSLDDRELSDAMKESGLGTSATRAATIEVLLKRGYIVRGGKNLEATEKGIHLIEVVHPEVKSPAMTGQWEARLKRIQQGDAQLAPFVEGIEEYVRAVVERVRQASPAARPAEASSSVSPTSPSSVPATTPPSIDFEVATPANAGISASGVPAMGDLLGGAVPGVTTEAGTNTSGASLVELLHAGFGFTTFRPNQEAVCRAVVSGKDALLVMPTGSGKSLCYQLPGVARGGTTLVISPLIALMDDQVFKLKQRGFAVECIHSGRDREESRQVCVDYLNGKLQFLFIAPERLRVPGFPRMLAKRKPSLIAIDEAHCISQWGHDFRPDYRMLGEYLPELRPAPLLALTATATPLVQKDIVAQLGLFEPEHFIHGFRRENLGIEVVEALPSQRPLLAKEVLRQELHRPAIVYTPTRKQAESLAADWAGEFKVSAYHAGLDARTRRRVQDEFMSGKLEVMVATIAFGMGIDKADVRTVIHTSIPGSLEGYYQEIGRAGRDGKPSRAILMQSYGDRRTHDYFFGRDYPEVSLLDLIYQKLRPEPQPKDALRQALAIEEDVFEKALEKLWTHKGVLLDFAESENVSRGDERWRSSYMLQANLKRAQIDRMIRFAESNTCRMNSLVQHFGDVSDSVAACGVCDFCAPAKCVAQRFRTASKNEQAALYRVLHAMRSSPPRSTGKLYAELYPGNEISRDDFEEILGAMARAELLILSDAVFEKDGKQIPYRTASLTAAGKSIDEKTPTAFVMKDGVQAISTGKRKKKFESRSRTPADGASVARSSAGPAAKQHTQPRQTVDLPLQQEVEKALRAWRLGEAARRKIPAFRIFGDRTLRALAAACPGTEAELLAIPGIGLGTVEKYGHQIFKLVRKG